MATKVLRCPNCKPHYRVASNGHRTGWVVREDYVGYLVVKGANGIKPPPKRCPECGNEMVKLLSNSP